MTRTDVMHIAQAIERGALKTGAAPRSNALSASRPRVALAGKLSAMAAPGGGETQLASLADALVQIGLDARLWRPWEDRWDTFDVLHLVGSAPEHLPLVDVARRYGKRVVLSPVAWFDLASYWREPRSLGGRLAACARFVTRAAFPYISSWRRRLYHSVDLLLPNSKAEAAQLVRYFGVPADRIVVTPNGADPRFAAATHEPFVQRFGVERFVLYPGRIEPRKNQLGFLRAMAGASTSIVVLGDAPPGNEKYMAACGRAASATVRFVPALAHDDPLLASAYAAATCVALTSWFETPGLVALEAGMLGVPLVLPEAGAAREYFGPLARYVRPNDRHGIRLAVAAAASEGRNRRLAALVHARYSWTAVAIDTRNAYEKLL